MKSPLRFACYTRMAPACMLDQLLRCKVGPICRWHDRWLIRCMTREEWEGPTVDVEEYLDEWAARTGKPWR